MSPLILRCADSQLTVSPFGAQALSWQVAGEERLWLSLNADLDGHRPIRGGVPLCFPWFGNVAQGPSHGFARTRVWQVEGQSQTADRAKLVLQLKHDAETESLWPHPFRAEMTYTLEANRLHMALTVANPGTQPFSYTAALHSYLRTDTSQLRLAELAGLPYHDKLADADCLFEDGANAALPPIPVDAIVPGLSHCRLAQGNDILQIDNQGHDAAVIWNPGPDHGIGDVHFGGEQAFICIESAHTLTPITLATGQRHTLSQTLTINA
ncbi:D-hexose-6-phosphate mutarotase [Halomonas denitrificans]|nr:D-hexose-6-phosphate mutarotase [Halomonas denitrificans]